MAAYVLTLTDEQDLALQVQVEEENARRAALVMPPETAPLPPVTAEDLLTEYLSFPLGVAWQRLTQTIETVNRLIQYQPVTTIENILQSMPSSALRTHMRRQRGL